MNPLPVVATMRMRPPSILQLPADILFSIVASLPVADILALSSTSKYLRAHTFEDEMVWRRKCIVDKQLNFKPKDWSWRQLFFDKQLKHVCHHLSQIDISERARAFASIARFVCGKCDVDGNDLWFCLSTNCNSLACSRKRNKHAMMHSTQTCHPLTLKVNTREIWCYEHAKWVGAHPSSNTNTARANIYDVDSEETLCHPAEYERVCEIAGTFGAKLPENHVWSLEDEWKVRRQRERGLFYSVWTERLYFVHDSWMSKWTEFLVGNCGPPGPIDNDRIIVDGLLDHQGDFVILSESLFLDLKSIYGGGPQISENDLIGNQFRHIKEYIARQRAEYATQLALRAEQRALKNLGRSPVDGSSSGGPAAHQ